MILDLFQYTVILCNSRIASAIMERHTLSVVLRRVSGPKREEVEGNWRKMLKEDLRNLDDSPHIIRVIKSRRMK
jgi:hypothetical protein